MSEPTEKLPPDAQVKLYMVGDQCKSKSTIKEKNGNLLTSLPFSGVGKTCLMLNFSGLTFATDHISTVGIDFKHKTVVINNKRVKIQVFTSHQSICNSLFSPHPFLLRYGILPDKRDFEL